MKIVPRPIFVCRCCYGLKHVFIEGRKLACPRCGGLGYTYNEHRDNLD